MARGYDDQTKAGALAQILTGATLHEVARATGIDRKTLRGWRDRLGEIPIVPPPKARARGSLLSRLTT